jgi:2-oxoglutarate ferredoxin oxidoreductase subunit alpha
MNSPQINDFVIQVATTNGSGSQSSNNILVRALFRMGLPVGGKNLFPSNIQGLPTWFSIRVNPQGFVGRKSHSDILVSMNPSTLLEDVKNLSAGGVLIYNSDAGAYEAPEGSNIMVLPVPFKKLAAPATDSVKLRKLLINMVYVGLLAELLGIEASCLESAVADQFAGKESVIGINTKAIEAGQVYAREHLASLDFPYRLKYLGSVNQDKILIDGNSASALGLVFGGCSFVSWYPITPSSSLVETFEAYARQYRRDAAGKANYAVVQAEDELAAISMVLGAGWAGARAMTSTSGPGISLMAEAAGLAYYAEIPAVIWDVQRVGPSTGLPTRTLQGDVLSAHTLSHGDGRHVVLFPASVGECFEFGQLSLDLAEQLQTLVFVLSDLDLGMNFHMAPRFEPPSKPFQRGKVLGKEDLEKRQAFARYADEDGDGIPYRTLPGTAHPLAAYFTRGTGHDTEARYSESPEDYRRNMDRLMRKWETARHLVPPSRNRGRRREGRPDRLWFHRSGAG